MTSLDEIRGRATLPLWPDTGRLLGVSKSAAYRAAEAGQIPTLRLGRRIVVPVPRLMSMLGAEGEGGRD